MPKKGWRAAQSHLKIKRKTKLALIVLGLVIVLIILGQVVNFTKVLFSPMNLKGLAKQDLWDGAFNINLVLRTNPISVVSFNPTQKAITLIELADETYLEVPQGFGKWQLRSVYDLGGGKLLKDSLTSFLAVPIDGMLELGGPLTGKKAMEIVEMMKNPADIFTLLPNLTTDLTLWDLLHLSWEISQVRFDKIKNIDLVQLNILEKLKLSDGSEVLIADPIRLDDILADLKDPTISSQNLSIAIFNGTPHPFLAQKAARIITNLGGNVIITSNTQDHVNKTHIFGQKSATLKRLIQIFGGIINPKLLGETVSRAQINILLGEDFYQRVGNK